MKNLTIGKDPITRTSFDNFRTVVEIENPYTGKRRTMNFESHATLEGRSLYSLSINFIEKGTDVVNKSYEITFILINYTRIILIRLRKNLVRLIAKSIPSLPHFADEFLKNQGQRAKIRTIHLIESRILEKLICLILLPSYCIKRSNVNIKEEATRLQREMKLLVEEMSDAIADIYSLKEGKLELSINMLNEAFSRNIFQGIGFNGFKVIKYIFETIVDATRKLITLRGIAELLVKMFLHTFLMEKLGPKNILFDKLSQEEQRDCINATDISSDERMCIQMGVLGVVTIKFIVFCIMVLPKMKKARDFIYPIIGFYLMNGPFYFLKKAGKAVIISFLIAIDKRLAVYFLVKVIEILIIKSVLKRFFEDSLRFIFEKIGLDNSNFEEVSKTLENFPENIKRGDLVKLIGKIDRLGFEKKRNLFDQLSTEEFKKLPLEIRNNILDFFYNTLLCMSNVELKDFFNQNWVGLNDNERQIRYDHLHSLSSEKKHEIRKLLYPIFNDLDDQTKKHLYRTLGFSIAELLLCVQIPKIGGTIGHLLEELLNEPLIKQEVVKLKKLSGKDKRNILGQLGKMQNISSNTRKLLFEHLITPNGRNKIN